MEYVRLFIEAEGELTKHASEFSVRRLNRVLDVPVDLVINYADYFQELPRRVETNGKLRLSFKETEGSFVSTSDRRIRGFVFTLLPGLSGLYRMVLLIGVITVWEHQNG